MLADNRMALIGIFMYIGASLEVYCMINANKKRNKKLIAQLFIITTLSLLAYILLRNNIIVRVVITSIFMATVFTFLFVSLALKKGNSKMQNVIGWIALLFIAINMARGIFTINDGIELPIYSDIPIQMIAGMVWLIVAYTFPLLFLFILKESDNYELQELNSTKDKLFSIIAHDLKGPIGNIAFLLEDIGIKRINPKILSQLQSSAQNTYELILDLLTWARAQKGHIETEPSHYSIYKHFEKLVSVMQHEAQQKNIRFLIPDESKDIFVFADLPSINTVLRNLVSNSIKFTEKGGSITLTAEVIKNKVKVKVCDTGVGIEPKKLSKLFNAGSDISSPGTMNEQGTGLGLLLCKEFIGLNKGEIGVESEINKGSTFWFTLPLGNVIDLENILELIKEKHLKTLIIENNCLNLQHTITEIAKTSINYNIAKDGKELIAKGLNKEYDFILMDIEFPQINGKEANKVIREKYPNAKIIALSSYSKTEIQQKDKKVDFDEFLRKPLTLDNLLYILKKLFIDKNTSYK